jgi:hypothetical protein
MTNHARIDLVRECHMVIIFHHISTSFLAIARCERAGTGAESIAFISSSEKNGGYRDSVTLETTRENLERSVDNVRFAQVETKFATASTAPL